MSWPDFCQHVLSHPKWQELPEAYTQADLERPASGFERVQVRLIEPAVHDAPRCSKSGCGRYYSSRMPKYREAENGARVCCSAIYAKPFAGQLAPPGRVLRADLVDQVNHVYAHRRASALGEATAATIEEPAQHPLAQVIACIVIGILSQETRFL